MNTALWIIAAVLAVAFAGAGLLKVSQDKDTFVASGQAWAEDLPSGLVTTIGGLEVLAALGLVLPPLVGTAEVLTPLAASGLVLLMLGAVVTHGRRREFPNVAVNLVLAGLAVFLAVERFGPHAF